VTTPSEELDPKDIELFDLRRENERLRAEKSPEYADTRLMRALQEVERLRSENAELTTIHKDAVLWMDQSSAFKWDAVKKAEAKVERLRAGLNEALAQVEYDQETGKDLVAEVKRLRAERDALKAALKKIVSLLEKETGPSQADWPALDIARQTLEEEK
jgi:hypothetical protein